MVKLEDLRSYTGHKVTSVQVGQVVKTQKADQNIWEFWVVEAQAIGECVLTPIIGDFSRAPITLK